MSWKLAGHSARAFVPAKMLCAAVLLGLSVAGLQSASAAEDSGVTPVKKLADHWTPLLDEKLSQWDSWVGVPLDSVKGLPPGTATSHDGKVGTPLGSILNVEKGNFRITAETGDGIKEIQVLRDGQLEKTIPVGAKIADANWTAQKQRAGEFWYCRVIMDNGHIAWTSPIWLG
jgi:hypothetical protein